MKESDPAGSQIYQASRQILDTPGDIGDLPTYKMDWSKWPKNPPQGIHCSELATADYLRFVRLWYERFYTDETWSGLTSRWSWGRDDKPSDLPGVERVFERFRTARILSPTRVGPQGTIRLNEHFAQNIRKAIGGTTLNGFGVGDLVICNRNDYRLELFNGDQGVIIKNAFASGESALWVVFEGGAELRLYPLHMVTQLLEYAFVLTVHKSQGSEFDTIALSLPMQNTMTLSKPLVYTAITRAKREVLVLGSTYQLMTASQTPLERFTTLQSRLSDTVQTEESK